MIPQLQNLRAFTLLFVLLALTMGRSATAQTYSIIPTTTATGMPLTVVIGDVTFHSGTGLSGLDSLTTYSDWTYPSNTSGKSAPFTTRLNYTLYIRYYYQRVQGSYTSYVTSSYYVTHQASGYEQWSGTYSDFEVDWPNTATQDPTQWFTIDVPQSPGTVTLLGIKYYYQMFASMEDVSNGIATWPGSPYTSSTKCYGTAPPGGW